MLSTCHGAVCKLHLNKPDFHQGLCALCTSKSQRREPQKNCPICWKRFCCDLKGPPHREILLFNPQRTGHSGAPEATVAIGVLAQVLLVVILCIVESLSLPDVGRDLAIAIL